MTETLAPTRSQAGRAPHLRRHSAPGPAPRGQSTPGTAPVPAQLTTARGAALYIGALLGPGLLLLPGLAAAEAGPASVLAWAGLLVLSGLFAVVFGALGRGFPSAGGVIGYVRAGLGARASGIDAARCLPDRRRVRDRAHRRRPARQGADRRAAARRGDRARRRRPAHLGDRPAAPRGAANRRRHRGRR